MTARQAASLTKQFAADNDLTYEKITGRTVDMVDLARATPIFVTVKGWFTGGWYKKYDQVMAFAKANGFFIEAYEA